jgi:hypothetical protein
MAEPTALNGLSWDDRQLLKEAVCDAILERTRKTVAGEGAYGLVVVGEKPSRTLSSGFILPRLNEDGDDESNDIRIAAHGMDIRLRSAAGVLHVTPTLSVYVRAIPTSEELFSREGRLIPRADFNDAARQHIRDEVARRLAQDPGTDTSPRGRGARRSEITRAVYVDMGVGVPTGVQLPAGDDRETDPSTEIEPSPLPSGRLRIPDRHSRRYDIPQKWVRLTVEAPALELPLPFDPARWTALAAAHKTALLEAIRATYATWISSPAGQESAWRNLHPRSEAFWERDAWDGFVATTRATAPVAADLIPTFDAQVLIQALASPLEPGEFSVRIALENLREADATMECGLFGVSLAVRLPNAALRPMRLERVRRSYHLAGFMTMAGIGVNGGVEDLGLDGDLRLLRTSWMPRYVLPRVRATEIPTVPTAYAALADDRLLIAELLDLPSAMGTWIESVRTQTLLSVPGEEGDDADETGQRARFEEDLAAWTREAARITRGIQVLQASQVAWTRDPRSPGSGPYRAWLLVNRSFAAANPPQQGDTPPGWRLFQLAFVLAHIPTLASRMPDFADYFDAAFDEDSVSLLYMSTGGGKTEAFFGILIFALFLDRLRGKLRGVTAMMHYPLRLLTVQQAQRLARLLARAEMIRREADIGGTPFEIGFWVGGGNTPNSTEWPPGQVSEALRCVPAWNHPRARDEEALLTGEEKSDREYAAAKDAWNKLPVCPFCRSNTGTALRLFPEAHHRLGIVCLEIHPISGSRTPTALSCRRSSPT